MGGETPPLQETTNWFMTLSIFDGHSLMKRISNIDILAIVITCLFVLLLSILSATYYSDEQLNGSFSLQQGPLPYNEFYPLLHPIVVRGIGSLLDDINAGAKLVSHVMAGVFVFAAYLLAAKSMNRKAGLICLFFMVTNLHVIVFGILVSTDMMAAAFVAVTLVLMVQLLSKPNSKTVIGLSLTFSLAYFTRYQSMLLLPTIFVCVFLSFRTSAKKCCLNVLIFVIATFIFLTPHFWLTTRAFGRPIYDQNWKNVAAKLYYDRSLKRHETYLDKVPFNGLMETIMHSPETFIKSGLNELVLFVRFGTSNILGLPPLLGGLFFTGLYFMLFSLSQTRLILLSFLAVFVIVISFAFFSTHARVMFPIFPICYLIIVEFLLSLDSKIEFKKYTIRPVTIFVILLCFAKGVSILPDLTMFLSKISGSG